MLNVLLSQIPEISVGGWIGTAIAVATAIGGGIAWGAERWLKHRRERDEIDRKDQAERDKLERERLDRQAHLDRDRDAHEQQRRESSYDHISGQYRTLAEGMQKQLIRLKKETDEAGERYMEAMLSNAAAEATIAALRQRITEQEAVIAALQQK